MAEPPSAAAIRLGRGRSAIVWADRDEEGREVARKIFAPDAASRLVFLLFYGATNPYVWSVDAVAAAVSRRRILARLLPLVCGDRLRLPDHPSARWHPPTRSFELVAERVHGHHVPLTGPAGIPAPDPLAALRDDVMAPLQRHLADAGFDGLVWQAGYGHPVASANFLLENDAGAGWRWVWIDCESGVPALFPLDPRALFTFYLPQALRRRRPLFDDVDVPRLRRWVARREADLVRHQGQGAPAALAREIDRLAEHQQRLQRLCRLDRSLLAALARGRVSLADAQAYRRRPFAWYARQTSRAAQRALHSTRRLLGRALRAVQRIPWGRLARGTAGFATSQRYRALLGRALVRQRIGSWEARGALRPGERRSLHAEVAHEDTSAWITDFGVHVAVKPFVKALQWIGVPLLVASGATGQATAAILLVAGGSIVRTLYTSGRIVQATLARHRKPWVALAVGTLPVVGNAAYPVQILASGMGRQSDLARFLLYDVFATVGRRLPIWGGADTLTEHWANRLPVRLVNRLAR